MENIHEDSYYFTLEIIYTSSMFVGRVGHLKDHNENKLGFCVFNLDGDT